MSDLREMITDGLRGEQFTTTFVVQWLDAEHSDYQVYEVYGKGKEVPVKKNQDIYDRWLKAGNVPAEREFVPPPAPAPDARTEAEKAADEYWFTHDIGRAVYDLMQRVAALEKGNGR